MQSFRIFYIPSIQVNLKLKIPQSGCSASYLDLLLEYDNEKKVCVKLYVKRDDFNFSVVNFPFLCSNIPSSPAYGVFVSHFIRYARASSFYIDFIARGKLLTSKLLQQGYILPKLIKSLRKFYGRHQSLVDKYDVSVSKLISDIFDVTYFYTVFFTY